MRVLYFATHRHWPVTCGAELRDYHLSQNLAARNEVTFLELLAPKDSPAGSGPQGNLREVLTAVREQPYTPGKILRGLAGPTALTILNYYSRAVAQQLTSLIRERRFDTIQLEGIHLSCYLSAILSLPDHPPVVGDWHNVESELMERFSETAPSLPKRLVAKRTAELLRRAEERSAMRGYRTLTVTSERERETLARKYPGADIRTIPNGVDLAHFAPIAERRSAGGPRADGRFHIVFVGSMDYHANEDAVIWFVRNVWPELAARWPDVHFDIVGRAPGPAVRALASGRVHVTGTVDDVRPFYEKAAALVVPLRVGGGTRLKILEAMAARVPIVSTALGAEGIDVQPGRDLLIADSAREILSSLEALRTKPELEPHLLANGYELVRSRYDWPAIAAQLDAIHQEAAQARRPRAAVFQAP